MSIRKRDKRVDNLEVIAGTVLSKGGAKPPNEPKFGGREVG